MDEADQTADLAGLEEDDDQPDTTVDDDAARSPKPAGPLDALIGRHIATLRRQLNGRPNRDDFAAMIRPKADGELWNKARLGRIERGNQRVTITELADICDTLGVDLGVFQQDAGVFTINPSTLGHLQADATISPTIRQAMIEQYRMAQRDWASNQRSN